MMITEVIFDCETKRLFTEIGSYDPAGLGVSIVSVYLRTVDEQQQELTGRMMSFWEHELPDMWEHFRTATRVIGFNSVKFDVPVLAPYAPKDFAGMKHFDIMQTVRSALGFSLSLNHLGQHNLKTQKTDVGINAVKYWQQHDAESLRKLKSYCEADVLLTRDLYDFGMKEKKLRYKDKWNTLREFAVDFSYPQAVIDSSRQIGLF